jgi:hypothetical protein
VTYPWVNELGSRPEDVAIGVLLFQGDDVGVQLAAGALLANVEVGLQVLLGVHGLCRA